MRWRRIAAWIGGILLALILLAIAAVFALDTDPGRRFVAEKIGGFETASGLKFQVGRLDGSLYGKLVIRDLRVSDAKGVFATAPRIELDWRPFEFIGSHVDIRSATAGLVTVERLPALKPTPPSNPNAPTLPDYDIDIGRLRIDRLVLAAPVTGTRRVLGVAGQARIADRRAQVLADVAAVSGGDRLHLMLDAVPDDDKLAIDARLDAPAGGVVATLAGLKAPLGVRIGGRGSWTAWNGQLTAALGGQPLAQLGVTARDGTFTVRGPLRPGLILAGPVARLTAPALNVDLTTALSQRRADTRLALRSDALAVDASGLIDLARSRLGGVHVDARLLRPGGIAPNLSGRDARLQLLLDGPFARPVVSYRVTADTLGFGATAVEGLIAEGRARVDKNRILVPVAARARRVTGLNASVGGLLTNVAINGDLAISGDTIFSDNLRIRSDKIDATAVVVADLSSGVYRGGLKGRVNNYLVQGVGILDLSTDVKLVTLPRGGFGITGRFAAQTVRIDNASARNFLGGRTVVTGDIAVGPDAAVTVTRLRLAAPKFRISDGGGFYRPNGTIGFRAQAYSDQYGPLAVVVSGTAQKPLIRLRATRPNVGIQLTNVDATVRGTGAGYEIMATGGSPYGPFSANLFVRTGGGPLSVDIRRARFAGVDFTGHVVQTAAGPFAGQLSLSGSGFVGTVRLSAVGHVQAAQVSARANGAQVPSSPPILIQRAIVEARLVLYPNAPLVVADIQAAGVRQETLLIQRARARINYQGGRGTAALVADGESGARFHLAANADLAPGLYRVATQGNVNGIDFRTVAPAEIRTVAGGYQLGATKIALPTGQVQLAGRYGPGLQLQARFNDLDLTILNAFSAGAGLGGRASGTLDFDQATSAAFPRADLKLLIRNFTRSGAAAVSEAVDLAVLGTLRPEGGDLRAAIRRRGALIGRLDARLQPVGAGGSWSQRLMTAPLAGGIRYNGPADVLWSLTGIADQQLTGPIGIAADFGGRVDRPQLNGVIRANALAYTNGTYGTRISAIRLTGRFTNDRLEISEFTGRAGDGTISAQGSIGLSAAAGYPIDIRATLNNARLARSDALGATATGTLTITNNAANGATVTGDLRLPNVRYQVIRQGSAEVIELTGIRRKGAPPPQPQKQEQAALPGLFKLDIHIRADNQIYVSGMGLDSEWGANLRVTGTSAAPAIVGRVFLVRGDYSFAGRRFDLDTTSTIQFEGGTNPALAITATSTIEDVAITLNITGRAQNPQIALTSTPALPQDELLSRVLFGSSVTSLSATQVIQLAAALNSLRGSGGGLNPLGKLRSATGISRLQILGADQTTGRGTAIAAGQYISNNIYLQVVTDARGFTATQIEIAISRALSLLSQASSFAGTSVELRYRKNY